MHSIVRDFRVDQAMRYSVFVPRLYNLCRSFGFRAGQMMPSRAFCSDESQGFPIILITKHFGAFPFNHGRAGGIVATGRHEPHAHHGEDMVIIQASHVGYDPETESFGHYCRLQTTDQTMSTTCGKVGMVLSWYLEEYAFAQKNVFLGREGEDYTITIDNQLLDDGREEGLILDLRKLLKMVDGEPVLLRTQSTSRVFIAAEALRTLLSDVLWPAEGERVAIGRDLLSELFSFRRAIHAGNEDVDVLENNLIHSMPWIVRAKSPILMAAQVNSQAEFDRTYRSIIKEKAYIGKRLLFISCLNIDISPKPGQLFPLTKCVPWAAYIQQSDGDSKIFEQAALMQLLNEQSRENPDQIDLEEAIQQMIDAPGIAVADAC
ncbi:MULTISPECIES: hypothetical protein [unclassified Lentimonas]|uniref:hypothetical protein n=1 Tax=unclassified Lentimonas TaxID=2630993 RepID=UPI001389CEE6|nr:MULTISPECIES: hypothetical protein [unclassified Lentimonas]